MGKFADAPMIGTGYLLAQVGSGKIKVENAGEDTSNAGNSRSYQFGIAQNYVYHHIYARREALSPGQRFLELLDGGLEAARFPYFAEIGIFAGSSVPESVVHYFDRRSAKMLFDAMEQAYKIQQAKEGDKQ